MDRIEKKKQEKEFQDFFLFSSISNMKTGMWVTLAFFISFRIISLIFYPESLSNQYFLRFGIIIPFIIATLVVLYIKSLQPFLNGLLAIITLLSSFAIFFVGALSDVHDAGYEYYYVWVMLVIMGTFVFYRIRFRNQLIIGGIMILSYTFATIYNHTLRDEPIIFTSNLFFIISIGSLGYFVSVYRHQSIGKIFLREKELYLSNKILQNEISEKEIAEAALNESQEHYRNLVDSLPDWLYVIDENLRFVMVNLALKEINSKLGITQDIIGKPISEIYYFASNARIKEIETVIKTGKTHIKEDSQLINGITFHVETRSIPIFRNHKVVRVMVIVRDISKKLEVEELRKKNIEQKEILLREIHHRVKNNLAIVISLLDMQVRKNPNPEFIKLSHDIEHRIRSMALIHEHLYKSDDLDRVPIDKYIIAITNGIARTYGSKNITTSFNVELVDVKIEIAMPLGLIANEILTNAFKYAFPGDRQGEIKIDVKGEETASGLYCLRITDNGIGLPDGFSIDEQSSTGMLIIQLLVNQIDARLVIDNHQGTSFSIIFKGIETKKQQK